MAVSAARMDLAIGSAGFLAVGEMLAVGSAEWIDHDHRTGTLAGTKTIG